MLVPPNYKYCGKFQSLNPYLHLKCLTMIILPMLRKRTIVTIQCNTVLYFSYLCVFLLFFTWPLLHTSHVHSQAKYCTENVVFKYRLQ